jgi:hypothetical protein
MNDKLNEQQTPETQKIIKKLREEAAAWHNVETFFIAVERQLLKCTPPDFNPEPIKNCLREMEEAQKSSSDKFFEIEFALRQKINNWRYLLAERDQKIETYHLRRFCENHTSPLNNNLFASLTRFYRGLPHSATIQSKFDFAVTRLYSIEENRTTRRLRLKGDELAHNIVQLFANWDGEWAQPSPELSEEAVNLEHFIREINTFDSFEDFVKSNIFERLRICKNNLGENFLEPSVVSKAIECNVLIGNAFARHLEKANENLGAKLIPEFDFAGVFHDVSPNVREHASEILREIKGDKIIEAGETVKPLEQVLEWLRIISLDAETEDVKLNQNSEVSENNHLDVLDVLDTLKQAQPDKTLIKNYSQKSDVLSSLNIEEFIENPESELCRKVLITILQAEELRAKGLFTDADISGDSHSEVAKVIQETITLGKSLQMKIPTADKETQNVLLTASNRLLESRLKLERSVIEYSRSFLENVDSELLKRQVINLPPMRKAAPVVRKQKRKAANRWLVAATVFVAILGIFAYSSASLFNPSVAQSKDVDILNVKNLPDGDYWKTAHRQAETLFVTAKDSWKTLDSTTQAKHLTDLLGYQNGAKFQNIVIVDGIGRPLGNATAEGIQTTKDLEKVVVE